MKEVCPALLIKDELERRSVALWNAKKVKKYFTTYRHYAFGWVQD